MALKHKVLVVLVLASLLLWAAGAVVDFLFFHEEPFLGPLITGRAAATQLNGESSAKRLFPTGNARAFAKVVSTQRGLQWQQS